MSIIINDNNDNDGKLQDLSSDPFFDAVSGVRLHRLDLQRHRDPWLMITTPDKISGGRKIHLVGTCACHSLLFLRIYKSIQFVFLDFTIST